MFWHDDILPSNRPSVVYNYVMYIGSVCISYAICMCN